MSDNPEMTISDGKTEVKTTLADLAKLAESAHEPQTDIFEWSNRLFDTKEDYSIQLFLMNKNGILYSLNIGSEMKDALRVKFLDGIMEAILVGAGLGLVVRRYEDTVKNDNALPWLPLPGVSRAFEAIGAINDREKEIEPFLAEDFDIKRQQAVVAKFSLAGKPSFYVFKHLEGTKAVEAQKGFILTGNKLRTFREDVALNIAGDNQVLIIDQDVFVFKKQKFEKLFGMKPNLLKTAKEKGAAIDQKFNLSINAIVQETSFIAQQSAATLKKLAEVDPDLMTQQQVMEAIDEFEVELMTDDNGAIVIADESDLNKFLDVLHDNYVHGATGSDYLAKNKKLLETE